MIQKIEELEAKIEGLELDYAVHEDMLNELLQLMVEIKAKVDAISEIAIVKKLTTLEEYNTIVEDNKSSIMENISYSNI